MLTFNDILSLNDIDLKDVALLRHRDLYPHEILSLGSERKDLKQFERAQSFQGTRLAKLFEKKYWAAFIQQSGTQALFVGLYLRKERYKNTIKKAVKDKNGIEIGSIGCHEYVLEAQKKLQEYQGRLIVDWGKGAVGWAVSAQNTKKPVVSLTPLAKDDKPFVGFDKFRCLLSKLEESSPSTIEELSNHTGIYCLSCTKTGKVYIGSAKGEDGFWGRWKAYMSNKEGGNKGLKRHLKELGKVDYYVSVLEVYGRTSSLNDLSNKEIEKREGIWKDKLQTRKFGLNDN